jgi:hypothetical protein
MRRGPGCVRPRGRSWSRCRRSRSRSPWARRTAPRCAAAPRPRPPGSRAPAARARRRWWRRGRPTRRSARRPAPAATGARGRHSGRRKRCARSPHGAAAGPRCRSAAPAPPRRRRTVPGSAAGRGGPGRKRSRAAAPAGRRQRREKDSGEGGAAWVERDEVPAQYRERVGGAGAAATSCARPFRACSGLNAAWCAAASHGLAGIQLSCSDIFRNGLCLDRSRPEHRHDDREPSHAS